MSNTDSIGKISFPDRLASNTGRLRGNRLSFTPSCTWEEHQRNATDSPGQYMRDETRMAEIARDLATELRDRYWAQGTYPVDPFFIGHQMGVSITLAPLNNDGIDRQSPDWVDKRSAEWICGALYKNPGEKEPSVVIETEDGDVGQRFTMAHEIGHMSTETIGLTSDQITEKELSEIRYRHRYGSSSYEEHRADLLAHLLLIPGEVLMSRLAIDGSVDSIAKYFAVSKTTADNRIKQLALLGI